MLPKSAIVTRLLVLAIGNELLVLCCSTELLIVNGQTPGNSAGEYIYTSPQGQSVVDYFVVSAQHSSAVADMTVMHSTAIFHIICPMTVRSRITSLFSLICHAALTHLALLPVVLHHNPALATSF